MHLYNSQTGNSEYQYEHKIFKFLKQKKVRVDGYAGRI